jgi:hypothetical protein
MSVLQAKPQWTLLDPAAFAETGFVRPAGTYVGHAY